MSFDCTNCNCTDLKMRKTCFLFITCIYLQFNFTHCLHTKKSIQIQRDLGKMHTQKTIWKQTAQFIKKEWITLDNIGVHFDLPNSGKLSETLQEKQQFVERLLTLSRKFSLDIYWVISKLSNWSFNL